MKLIGEFLTELCADSIEFDRGAGQLAIGTYQLETDGSKHGKLYIFDGGSVVQSCSTLDTDAILDMKYADHGLFLATNSRGIGTLKDKSVEYACDEHSSVHLSMAIAESSIFSSTNTGDIIEYDIQSLQETRSFPAHSSEVWTVAIVSGTLLTGADDCLLKAWDRRSTLSNPLFINKRHSAGVCSIAPHPTIDHLFATGSYDKTLRLWDIRHPSAALHEITVQSGVWRVVWHPEKPGLLAAACMHDGFHLFKYHGNGIDSVDHCPSGSLAYGCCFADDRLVGCSFYDKRAYEWSID